jgi:plastocyanin/LysM repeat protein
MSAAPKPKRRLPWKGSTLIVFAFLLVTILPAFIAFALTPPDARVVTSVEGWNGCMYTVRRGDNLFRIGMHYGVTYHYIAQMNGIINPNYVWAGQVITVPCGAVTFPEYGGSYRPASLKKYPPYQCPWCQPFDIPAACAANITTYTVAAGDNLFRIAVNHGSTIQWIRTENDMWGKVLRPGMILTIPCVGYVQYGPNVWTPTPGQGIITATFFPTLIPTQQPPQGDIRMQGGRFRPQRREVSVGTTVTWVNTEPSGGPAYTVTSGVNGEPNGRFNSGPIAPGGNFIFTFSEAGSYQYYSETDPTGMTGEIIVTP